MVSRIFCFCTYETMVCQLYKLLFHLGFNVCAQALRVYHGPHQRDGGVCRCPCAQRGQTIFLQTFVVNSRVIMVTTNISVFRIMKMFQLKRLMLYSLSVWQAQEIAGIKIFRFEAPLYFGNVDHFRRSLAAETGLDPKELKIVHKVIKETDLSLHHEQVRIGTQRPVVGTFVRLTVYFRLSTFVFLVFVSRVTFFCLFFIILLLVFFVVNPSFYLSFLILVYSSFHVFFLLLVFLPIFLLLLREFLVARFKHEIQHQQHN